MGIANATFAQSGYLSQGYYNLDHMCMRLLFCQIKKTEEKLKPTMMLPSRDSSLPNNIKMSQLLLVMAAWCTQQEGNIKVLQELPGCDENRRLTNYDYDGDV